jgi:GH35 family endo-1,4-beta-xylanase
LGGVVPVALLALSITVQRPPEAPYRAVHTLNADARTLRLAKDAGFDTVVQLFSWRQIEPTRGEYHWQYPDEVVQGAVYYGLNLVVRLDQHPQWSADAPLTINAPPKNHADFERFVRTVASRYQGQVSGYVIWNEPNLAIEWGGKRPDPAGYARLLKGAFEAIKAADPNALVVSAGLASTGGHGDAALDDREYLEGMYAAGAAAHFDVLGAHPYGFAYPPDDPRGAHQGLNMARMEDLRDIMVRYGDGRKPVWATEMGWTVRGEGPTAWQTVTEQQQADYLFQAFDLAPKRWPWLDMLAVWNLGDGRDSEWDGYNLLDASGKPRPAYTALQQQFLARPSNRLADKARTLNQRSASGAEMGRYQVLARDSIIHLGDGEFTTPWVPLYGARNPSSVWEGTVYVDDPGDRPWTLTMRLMQSNAASNFVWINGQRLAPPFHPEDYSNSWVTHSWSVRAEILTAGPNRVRVTIDGGVPESQPTPINWDDLQFKDIVLRRGLP